MERQRAVKGRRKPTFRFVKRRWAIAKLQFWNYPQLRFWLCSRFFLLFLAPVELSDKERNDDIGRTFRTLYSHLLTDAGYVGCDSDIAYLHRRVKNESYAFVTQTLPQLGKALYKGISSGTFVCPTSFERTPNSALPKFLGSLFCEVFDRQGKVLSNPSAASMLIINQICMFAYKCDLPYSEEKKQAVIDGFVATEEEVSGVSFDSPDPILDVANIVVRDLFRDYSRDRVIPKHGPGVTANVPVLDKYEHRLTSLPSVSNFGQLFFLNTEHGLTDIGRYPVRTHWDLFDPQRNNCAKVILVPKDSRGPRLISCEPAENQWIQQGIAGYMIDALESNEISRGRVNFTDQSVNRELARVGSISKEWSTLDLKDASDRVTLALVRRIFEDTALLPDLLTSRSTHTLLPDGRKVKLSKFAPMGSACCFPVLATTVYALCVAMVFGLTGDFKYSSSHVYVYGDDVIVPTAYAGAVISCLERYALKVNRDKSFINSNFLESCGMDAFYGNPINPTRLKVCPTNSDLSTSAQNLASVLETANLLHTLGWSSTSSYLLSRVESFWGYLPYGYPHSPFLNRNVLRFQGKASDLNANTTRLRGMQVGRHNRGRIRVLALKTDTTYRDETLYARLMRILPLVGSGQIPEFGRFTKRGIVSVKQRIVGAAAMSEFPASKWLPN